MTVRATLHTVAQRCMVVATVWALLLTLHVAGGW
jgi:hypothetical protein